MTTRGGATETRGGATETRIGWSPREWAEYDVGEAGVRAFHFFFFAAAAPGVESVRSVPDELASSALCTCWSHMAR